MTTAPTPKFASPSEFLEQIRLACEVGAVKDEWPENEMQRLTREDLERHGVSPSDMADPYRKVIDDLVGEISGGFKSQYDVDISDSCAFGALQHPAVNARCFYSGNGLYAIVLHYGLMNLLHKHTKLLTAALDPSTVVYCNRKSAEQLTSTELQAWALELGDIYRRTGETKGAIVKLKPEPSSAAARMLSLGEAFVLGHEIGHMIAGHLEASSRLSADTEVPWLQFLPENSSHKYELEADEYGFFAMQAHQPDAPKSILLGALVATFATMSLVGAGQGSASHPSSLSRIHHVVALHFSQETAELVHRWVDDEDEKAAITALETAH